MMMNRIPLLMLLLVPSLLLAQTTNFPSRNGQTDVAFSATPIFDASKSNAFKITLTANVTSSTLIGAEKGQWITLEICQDGTGSRTFVPPASWQGFVTITSGASTCTEEAGHYDGTNIVTPPSSGGGGSGTVNSGTANQLAKYPGTGTTVGGSGVATDDGTTLTYSGTGGVSTAKITTTGAGSGALVATEGAPPAAVSGKDILAADSISHAMQLSNNGGGYQPLATNSSTSPTLHGIAVGAGFPAFSTIPAGSFGQPLISCGSTCDPGFGSLDAAGGFVNNRFPKTNLLTTVVYTDQANTYSSGLQDFSAVTFKTPITAGAAPTTNGLIQYDSTSNNYHGGLNGADSKFASFVAAPNDNDCVKWTKTGGNFLLGTTGGACGAGGSSRWDQITAATTGATTDNGDNAIIYRTASTTSGRIGWRETESAASVASGTPFLRQIDTLAGSTAGPLNICSGGTANCWQWNTAALFKPIGTASIAIPGSAKGVVVSQGGSAAATTVTGTNNQLLSFDVSGNPIAADPIISYNYINIWTAQDVTVTRTSAAVRNPVFSQTGTLQFTWASITGSPATCTIQIQGVDSVGNALNNGSTFSVSPANGTTSQTFTAASTLQSAAQIKAIFACGTYPTTGTLTLDFTPVITIAGTVTTVPPTNASTNVAQWATQNLGAMANYGTSPGAVLVPGVNAFITNIPHAITDSGSVTAATLSAETTKVIGTARILGNGGAIVDQAPGSAVPANVVMSGLSDGTNSRRALGDTTGRQFVIPYADTTTTSYHASTTVASAASATDIAVMPGNATNTVLLNKVSVTCTQTTAGIITLNLILRTTADSAGTSSGMTAVKDDQNYASAVSAPLKYTANPTINSTIGNLDTVTVGCLASTTGAANDIYIFKPLKPIVLRGTAQQVAVNLGSTTITGGSFAITFDWSETLTP